MYLVWNWSNSTLLSGDLCRSNWEVPRPLFRGGQVQEVDWGQLHWEVVYPGGPDWTWTRTGTRTNYGRGRSPGRCTRWGPSRPAPPPPRTWRRSRSWRSRGRCWRRAWSGTRLRTRHKAKEATTAPTHNHRCWLKWKYNESVMVAVVHKKLIYEWNCCS